MPALEEGAGLALIFGRREPGTGRRLIAVKRRGPDAEKSATVVTGATPAAEDVPPWGLAADAGL